MRGVRRSSVVLALAIAACSPGSIEPPHPFPPAGSGRTGSPPPGPDGAGGRGGSPGRTPGSEIFFGTAVSAENAPPPLSGGTLLILAGGKTALVADPDRDALYLADLETETLLATLPLQPGDEPGRAVQDGGGAVHVVARRGGAVVTVDFARRSLVSRRPVCSAPRGIAYDRGRDLLHVACAGGELLALPPAASQPIRRMQLDRDLRDVAVSGDKLFVSRFRTAEVLVLSALDGSLLERLRPPGSRAAQRPGPSGPPVPPVPGSTPPSPPLAAATPGVGWRLRGLPGGGGVVLIHQESSNGQLGTGAGAYGGGPCKGLVGTAYTRFLETGAATTSSHIMFANLPLDIAFSADGKRVALVAAGNANSTVRFGPQVLLANAAQMESGDCVPPPPPTAPEVPEVIEMRQPQGEAIAVEFDGLGRVVVQTREPARLEIVSHRGGSIELSRQSRFDTGHAVFHAATANGVACAVCHPEGADDARVWRFSAVGDRRTQSLLGGIVETAPFHWDGDMRDLGHLMEQVFTGRMGGVALGPGHVQALSRWIDRLPALPRIEPADPAAAARGKTLFADAKVACATCHAGPALTNNATVSVGTTPALQVPSLRGVVWRAPFMHNGCAPTLRDRFDRACGGDDRHGVTSHLTAAQIDDLTAYLESL
jgi:mono/diheme cytochrome c family protein